MLTIRFVRQGPYPLQSEVDADLINAGKLAKSHVFPAFSLAVDSVLCRMLVGSRAWCFVFSWSVFTVIFPGGGETSLPGPVCAWLPVRGRLCFGQAEVKVELRGTARALVAQSVRVLAVQVGGWKGWTVDRDVGKIGATVKGGWSTARSCQGPWAGLWGQLSERVGHQPGRRTQLSRCCLGGGEGMVSALGLLPEPQLYLPRVQRAYLLWMREKGGGVDPQGHKTRPGALGLCYGSYCRLLILRVREHPSKVPGA